VERDGNGSGNRFGDRPGNNGNGSPRIGLALAGGGPEGAIYEIGALRALDEALDGLDLNDLYVYVGVSAGAFIGANLVNNLTTAEMCRAIVSHEPGEHPFVPETFLTPAVREIARGGQAVPRLLLESVWQWLTHRKDLTLMESLTRLSEALPVGIFDNRPIRDYLSKIYNMKGRTDDFRELGKRFVVVAADLDSGQAVRFGEPGMDHVPISLAVAASSALPGIYSPVEIDGRLLGDGGLAVNAPFEPILDEAESTSDPVFILDLFARIKRNRKKKERGTHNSA